MPRAVITGAAGGIGGVCAAELGSSGWSVTGLDLRAGNDPAIDWVEVDVRDRNGLGAVSANLGPVDLLVNAAGTADAAPAADMSADQWSAVLDVCLTGTFNACQALHPNLELGGGTVVNIASAAARTAFSNHANYCVAKVGVEMLTKVLAIEWAPEIRVVGISPGYVDTPLFRRGTPVGSERETSHIASTPAARIARPEEIAGIIRALASKEFAFVTGTTLVADGGFTAKGGEGRVSAAKPGQVS